jgi:hypothetical protein
MSSSDPISAEELEAAATAIAATVDDIVQGGDVFAVPEGTVQKLMTAAVRLYAARVERGGYGQGDYPPALAPGALNATQGMIATTAILRAVDVQLFELGLWQAWAQ